MKTGKVIGTQILDDDARDGEYPTIRRKVVRRVEIPVEKEVKVPVKLLGDKPTDLQATKEVKYVEYEPKTVVRKKEIWVKRYVPEVCIEQVPVVKTKVVSEPAGRGIPHKVVPPDQADAFRIERVKDKKIVEVEEWVEYKLQPVPVGKSIPVSYRELESEGNETRDERGIGRSVATSRAVRIRREREGWNLPQNVKSALAPLEVPSSQEGIRIVPGNDPDAFRIKHLDRTVRHPDLLPVSTSQLSANTGESSDKHANVKSSTSAPSYLLPTRLPHKTHRGGWARHIQSVSSESATSTFDSVVRKSHSRSRILSKLGRATFGTTSLTPRPVQYKVPSVSKPPAAALAFTTSSSGRSRSQILNLTLRNTTTTNDTAGVAIDASPSEGSIAHTIGLRKRDIITQVNHRSIKDVTQFSEQVNHSVGAITLTLWRGAQQVHVCIPASCFT